MIIVLKDCFVWQMEHVRNNVILIFIVPKVKNVSVMEVASILVRRKMTVHLVNTVIWIIRFVMTFVFLTSLVIQDTNVTMEPVTNLAVLLTNVVMINFVQSEFYFRYWVNSSGLLDGVKEKYFMSNIKLQMSWPNFSRKIFFQIHIIFRNGWCDLKCKSDSDCPNKQTCIKDGSCQNTCKDNKECRNGRVCYANNPEQPKHCVTACSHDSHCNQKQYCFYNFNTCVEKCSKVGCPAGWSCDMDHGKTCF